MGAWPLFPHRESERVMVIGVAVSKTYDRSPKKGEHRAAVRTQRTGRCIDAKRAQILHVRREVDRVLACPFIPDLEGFHQARSPIDAAALCQACRECLQHSLAMRGLAS